MLRELANQLRPGNTLLTHLPPRSLREFQQGLFHLSEQFRVPDLRTPIATAKLEKFRKIDDTTFYRGYS